MPTPDALRLTLNPATGKQIVIRTNGAGQPLILFEKRGTVVGMLCTHEIDEIVNTRIRNLKRFMMIKKEWIPDNSQEYPIYIEHHNIYKILTKPEGKRFFKLVRTEALHKYALVDHTLIPKEPYFIGKTAWMALAEYKIPILQAYFRLRYPDRDVVTTPIRAWIKRIEEPWYKGKWVQGKQ